MKKLLYRIFKGAYKASSSMGILLGVTAIIFGAFSAQNIKSELKETRIHMNTVIQRSDLLTRIVNIESYLDNSLINLADRFKLIVKFNDYKITELGKSTLSDLDVFNYLENIYYDQPNITTIDLIIRILSENFLSESVWYFNEKREKRKERRFPLEAILATIIVHHESRHEKTQ